MTHHLGVLVRVGFTAWFACLVVVGGAALSSSDGTTIRLIGAASACAAVTLLVTLAKLLRARVAGEHLMTRFGVLNAHAASFVRAIDSRRCCESR